MPSSQPTSDISIDEGTISITSGLFDTDDGFKAKVAGDSYPRIHLTPQGEVKTGDGTAPPEEAAPVLSAGGWSAAMTIPAVSEWWPTPFATIYAGATTLNRVYYVAIWIPAGVSMIDGLSVEVTTTNATALGRLGLYTADPVTHKPASLVVDAGTVNCSAGGGAAGVRTVAVTATTVTPDSLYYVAYCAQTATAAVRQAATGLILRNFSIPSSTVANVYVRTETLAYGESSVTGGLPATATPARFAAVDGQPILSLKRHT